tara:strand:- start:2405 stop:2668 length:264 start_codon:yes stop_codon:yes gene_type:complete
MNKVINMFFIALILSFLLVTYKYYSSSQNIEKKNYNRNNIDEIINTKTSNLPILENDTKNVIEFNDGFSNNIKNDKPRSFWNLLKTK